MIDARGLTARVGSFRLHDVTFTVPKAAYGVVIGPAGSGKTTLLETIAGITPQTGGSLSLDGRPATGLPPELRGLGLVYQHGYLFPHLSVEANIAYGASDATVAREVATRMGAWDLRGRAVESLSGGSLVRSRGSHRSGCSMSPSARSTRDAESRRVASFGGFIASGG